MKAPDQETALIAGLSIYSDDELRLELTRRAVVRESRIAELRALIADAIEDLGKLGYTMVMPNGLRPESAPEPASPPEKRGRAVRTLAERLAFEKKVKALHAQGLGPKAISERLGAKLSSVRASLYK